jgi:thioredoxin-like negative regulator of GroEL
VCAPDDANLRHKLALVLLARGAPSEAVSELKRTVATAPDHVAARCDLAVMLLADGAVEAAMTQLDEALRHAPQDARARWYKALALEQIGRPGAAAPLFAALAREDESKYGEMARARTAEEGEAA